MESIKEDEIELMWERAGKNKKSLGVMLLMHSDLWLEKIYSFDCDFLAALMPEEKIDTSSLKTVMNLLSFEFGDLSEFDTEHFILGNPIRTKPFIKLADGKYFTGVMGLIPDASLDILESLIWRDDAIKDKYTKLKANYLEEFIIDLIKKYFPSAKLYVGSLYSDIYENDILCIIDSFALVIEAKSGRISESGLRGAPKTMFKELQELIEEPSQQALRFIDFLGTQNGICELNTKNKGVNKINVDDIKYFLPLGITFSNLSTISGNLKKLISTGVTTKPLEELAPSISFTDLEMILELLESEPQRIHYLVRRREFEAHVDYEGDEMDLLGFYLDTGFNIGEDEYKQEMVFNFSLKSKELDPYIVGSSEGRSVPRPRPLMTQWWRDIASEASKKKTPGWIETCFILFNFAYSDQVEFERQLKKLEKQIKNGSVEKPHNWGLFLSGPERRRYALAVYPYITADKNERNGIMEQIFNDATTSYELRGMIVIGKSLVTPHYPYNVIARKASTDLFDVLTLDYSKKVDEVGDTINMEID